MPALPEEVLDGIQAVAHSLHNAKHDHTRAGSGDRLDERSQAMRWALTLLRENDRDLPWFSTALGEGRVVLDLVHRLSVSEWAITRAMRDLNMIEITFRMTREPNMSSFAVGLERRFGPMEYTVPNSKTDWRIKAPTTTSLFIYNHLRDELWLQVSVVDITAVLQTLVQSKLIPYVLYVLRDILGFDSQLRRRHRKVKAIIKKKQTVIVENGDGRGNLSSEDDVPDQPSRDSKASRGHGNKRRPTKVS